MDIDKFIKWCNEYFISPPEFNRPEEFDMALAGYLFAKREMNDYQKEWRHKNKDKCEKYIKYRIYSDERKAEIREYQRNYYRKTAAAKKLKTESL